MTIWDPTGAEIWRFIASSAKYSRWPARDAVGRRRGRNRILIGPSHTGPADASRLPAVHEGADKGCRP